MRRLLQLKVISTGDLRIKKKTITNSLFVVLRTDCNTICSSKKLETEPKTGNHHECKHDNNTLEMELPMHVAFISVEVHYSKGKNYCDNSKFIGAARIPVSDFVGSFMPENYVQFLSYRLRDADGVLNGVINLSITVASSGYVPKVVVSPSAMPELGIRVHHGKIASGIVAGVPVNWYKKSCI